METPPSFVPLAFKDLVTLAATASGVGAMWYALSSSFPSAAALIALAAIFDYADGVIARASKVGANDFGKQLDSLSDAVAFAAAPAFMALAASHTFMTLAGCMVFACAGVVRLSRFNMQTEKGLYFGLPIPAAGVLAALTVVLAVEWTWLALIVLAGLMVAPIRINKF